MSMGPGGIGQSSGHTQNNLNDSMAPGLTPTSMMQNQMSNGEIFSAHLTTTHLSVAIPRHTLTAGSAC